MSETISLGKRIVIEGVDGTGKSYQARRLFTRLAESGVRMCNFLIDEPDGAYRVDSLEEVVASETWNDAEKWCRTLVPEAAILRKLVKDKTLQFTTAQNVEIMTRSRELNWSQASLPALNRDESMVTARSDVSTDVYQGYAEGFGIENARALTAARLGSHYMNPDLLIILDFLDEAERQKRLTGRDDKSAGDAFESRPADFQQAIREGYRLHQIHYGGILIAADGSRDDIHEQIWQNARRLFDF